MKKPSEERGCLGKATLSSANYKEQADKLAKIHNKQFICYKCPHCEGVHLTTKIQNASKYDPPLHLTEV